MKLVCAPVKVWPRDRAVDLYEFASGSKKLLFDRTETLRLVDMDWKETPSCADIISYHDFEKTSDLEQILSEMKKRHPAARYYKIATFANSILDALAMLSFQKNHPDVIGICMGEKGIITRILSPFTYAPLSEADKNAPGQLLWSELDVIYRYRSISSRTRLYGLIGNPVSHSIGHLFHNDQFHQNQVDAIYVKLPLQPEELIPFFDAIKSLPFYGFSVTAPLKEQIADGKSINTLYRTENGWQMCNTDGVAAADVLGDVARKRVVILGAGGAAKAIASVLIQRGAHVVLLRRHEPIPLYDILINATSSKSPDFQDRFIKGKTVMDISIQATPFLQKAQSSGCQTIDGFPMFFGQALLQSQLWKQHYPTHTI